MSEAALIGSCGHPGWVVAEVCNVNDALEGHVLLDLGCLDRIY